MAGCWPLGLWRATTTYLNMPAYWLARGWCAKTGQVEQNGAGPHGPISVFLADDNLIVREGVRALINARKDLHVVGVAADYDELVSGAEATRPQVLVTDIRMPPTFTREGIDAAREVRKRHPGTGVVVLSQYDDPEYAVSLLAEGSAGYGYLLKDRVAEGSQLVDAIRVVATGGTALDPAIVEALVAPVVPDGRPAARGGGAARPGRRGPDDQGDRRGAPGSARGGRRGGRRGVRQAGPERVRGERQRAAAAPPAAPGHRRPRGAGRDAVPAAAERPGREAAAGAARHRGDRTGHRDRADERHPLVLGHRRARRPEPAGRAAQHASRGDEPGHPGSRRAP